MKPEYKTDKAIKLRAISGFYIADELRELVRSDYYNRAPNDASAAFIEKHTLRGDFRMAGIDGISEAWRILDIQSSQIYRWNKVTPKKVITAALSAAAIQALKK